MKQLFGRLVFPLALVVTVLLGLGLFYLYWYSAQKEAAIRRYDTAMTVLATQAQEATRDVLQVFATTAAAHSLADLLGIYDTNTALFKVRRRSISRTEGGSAVSEGCLLGFEKESEPTLYSV